MINPSRIEVAVGRRRLSKRDLAIAMGVDERTVRRWLEGKSTPTTENVEKMSEVLAFPAEFFSGPDLEFIDYTQPSFRARRAPIKLLNAATQSAVLAFEIERVLVKELRFRLPENNIPELPQMYIGDPESAALWVRNQWGLRDQPIRNVVALLEKHGVRVFSLPPDMVEGKVSAFYVDNQNGTPFILLNTRDAFSGERTRFDAAHELGHIILHRKVAVVGSAEESEADRFASAFLMPKESVLQAAANAEPSIAYLQHLKLQWGVSVAALARRLYDFHIFSERQYKRVNIELARYGWKREPNPIRGEVSKLLPEILRELRAEGGLSMLSALTLLFEKELNEYLFGLALTSVDSTPGPSDRGGPETKPQLSLVQ